MISILRYIGVHLWVSSLFAIPVSFFILPKLIRFFSGINPLVVGGLIIIGTICLFSFLMDAVARKLVNGLIKEGQTWERSGIVEKAKKRYIRALRIYDTFLLWPFSAKTTTLKISGAIAGFQLSTRSEDQNMKLGTAVYLKINPQDVDISKLWLTQIIRSSIVTSFDQEVLTILAQAHAGNNVLSPLIAEIFLGLRRNDYAAKKIYQEVSSHPDFANLYLSRIQELTDESDEPGKLDESSRETPFKQPPNFESESSGYFLAARSQKRIEIKKYVYGTAGLMLSFVKRVWSAIGAAFNFLALSAKRIITYFKDHEKVRFYLKASVLTIICGVLAYFMISALAHTFKTRAQEKERIAVEVSTPKPFTIQVAAYLKQSHAQRYVDLLKKQKIDASIKEVAGGGKTWFVVRVSKFIDKKSAADYGQKLKQQGIIDDFFVNNR